MVARSMTRSEVMNNPKAIEAVNLEWSKLRNKKYIDPVDGKEKAGAWDESLVREFRDVKREYDKQGKTFHVARIFDLCVEKGSELPEGHKDRTCKGRVVFWLK